MVYPHETVIKNAFITVTSELPVVLKSEFPENDAPVYTQSKRTWKSYFWSSESFKLRKDPRIIADWPTIALDVPKDEALFLTKLDLTLISASALGVMCRYLDQVNITNTFSMLSSDENTSFCVWHVIQTVGWKRIFHSTGKNSIMPTLFGVWLMCLVKFPRIWFLLESMSLFTLLFWRFLGPCSRLLMLAFIILLSFMSSDSCTSSGVSLPSPIVLVTKLVIALVCSKLVNSLRSCTSL